jgi:threonine aldolase
MYEAMLSAPLGDDVLGDEPTVRALEELAAQTMGKEAALFVPSGTMANQIALACSTSPGDSALFEEEAHMLYYESGAPAVIAQVITRTVRGRNGVMDPEDVRNALLQKSLHTPGTAVICVENTHNRAGGTIVPLQVCQRYRQIADEHGVFLHLDGARIFNAAVATGVGASDFAQLFDSVSFCLSKGLRSPVGSVLCGTHEFIARARFWRKRLGGAMRQSGILAACGIVSLTRYVERLADDHRRAKELAELLANVPGLAVDRSRVETNMVLVETERSASDWIELLGRHGVRALAVAPNRIRLVLHADIGDEDVSWAAQAFAEVAARLTPQHA